jgi:hypothetical protein
VNDFRSRNQHKKLIREHVRGHHKPQSHDRCEQQRRLHQPANLYAHDPCKSQARMVATPQRHTLRTNSVTHLCLFTRSHRDCDSLDGSDTQKAKRELHD